MLEVVLWIFLISAGIQFLFFSVATIAIAAYKSPQLSADQLPAISVVICANNEYENLLELIPAVLKQNHPKFELILVDDRSSDETYDYAIELQRSEKLFKLLRIDETPDHIQNKKYGITIGVKAAKYNHVLLTDADCMPSGDNWISEMSVGFKDDNTSFVLGYSQYETAHGFLNHLIKYETILTAINYVGLALLGNPYMAVGRNLAYTKSVFLKNKGFGRHQAVVGGDDDLFVNQHATRKNTCIVLSPDATVYSIPKTSFGAFLRQKTRHLSVGKHYRMPDKLLLGLLTISKITFWISFIAAIMSVNQTLLISSGFLLVMVSLLTSVLALKKKTGDDLSIWLSPLLDFIYLIYYISTGLKVLFTKKVRWK
jgi:cellulose synthase/poly-beta-1,6-N-acetylglucosamine synthase-like glycosyltransferase